MRPRIVAAERSDSTMPPLSRTSSKALSAAWLSRACASEQGMLPRIVAPARRVGDERRQEPHQGAPFLHGAAKMVHRFLARALRIEQRGAGVEQDMAGDGAAPRVQSQHGAARPGLSAKVSGSMRGRA